MSPNYGTATGGTHVHIRGDGFATDTYGGGNTLFMFDPSIFELIKDKPGHEIMSMVVVPCDVIEGACTVDCGGPRKIVCDTRPYYEQMLPSR